MLDSTARVVEQALSWAQVSAMLYQTAAPALAGAVAKAVLLHHTTEHTGQTSCHASSNIIVYPVITVPRLPPAAAVMSSVQLSCCTASAAVSSAAAEGYSPWPDEQQQLQLQHLKHTQQQQLQQQLNAKAASGVLLGDCLNPPGPALAAAETPAEAAGTAEVHSSSKFTSLTAAVCDPSLVLQGPENMVSSSRGSCRGSSGRGSRSSSSRNSSSGDLSDTETDSTADEAAGVSPAAAGEQPTTAQQQQLLLQAGENPIAAASESQGPTLCPAANQPCAQPKSTQQQQQQQQGYGSIQQAAGSTLAPPPKHVAAARKQQQQQQQAKRQAALAPAALAAAAARMVRVSSSVPTAAAGMVDYTVRAVARLVDACRTQQQQQQQQWGQAQVQHARKMNQNSQKVHYAQQQQQQQQQPQQPQQGSSTNAVARNHTDVPGSRWYTPQSDWQILQQQQQPLV
jgi:hypothetical protein